MASHILRDQQLRSQFGYMRNHTNLLKNFSLFTFTQLSTQDSSINSWHLIHLEYSAEAFLADSTGVNFIFIYQKICLITVDLSWNILLEETCGLFQTVRVLRTLFQWNCLCQFANRTLNYPVMMEHVNQSQTGFSLDQTNLNMFYTLNPCQM